MTFEEFCVSLIVKTRVNLFLTHVQIENRTAGLPLPAFQTDTPTAVSKHGDVTAQGALKRQNLNIRTNWRIQQRLFYIVLLHVFIMLFVFYEFYIFFLYVCVHDLLWRFVVMFVPYSASKTTTDITASLNTCNDYKEV